LIAGIHGLAAGRERKVRATQSATQANDLTAVRLWQGDRKRPPPGTYPPASGEQPLIAGIHGLATHGTYCRATLLPPRSVVLTRSLPTLYPTRTVPVTTYRPVRSVRSFVRSSFTYHRPYRRTVVRTYVVRRPGVRRRFVRSVTVPFPSVRPSVRSGPPTDATGRTDRNGRNGKGKR